MPARPEQMGFRGGRGRIDLWCEHLSPGWALERCTVPEGSQLDYSCAASRRFGFFSPARKHSADKSVLKIYHCQKYQEETDLVPEKSC